MAQALPFPAVALGSALPWFDPTQRLSPRSPVGALSLFSSYSCLPLPFLGPAATSAVPALAQRCVTWGPLIPRVHVGSPHSSVARMPPFELPPPTQTAPWQRLSLSVRRRMFPTGKLVTAQAWTVLVTNTWFFSPAEPRSPFPLFSFLSCSHQSRL